MTATTEQDLKRAYEMGYKSLQTLYTSIQARWIAATTDRRGERAYWLGVARRLRSVGK